MLNKQGVSYKRPKGSYSGKDGSEDFEESIKNGPKKTKSEDKNFQSNSNSDTVQKVEENGNLKDDANYMTPKKCNGVEYVGEGTQKSPWVLLDQSKPATPSISFPSTAELCRRAKEENNGKRKRVAPKKLSDYMVSGNGPKRVARTTETSNIGK